MKVSIFSFPLRPRRAAPMATGHKSPGLHGPPTPLDTPPWFLLPAAQHQLPPVIMLVLWFL